MAQRLNIHAKGQQAMKAVYGLGIYLAKSPVEPSLLNLIYYRVSQINGCAYCLDMHSKDLRAKGETEQRLLVLNAWREAPFILSGSVRRWPGLKRLPSLVLVRYRMLYMRRHRLNFRSRSLLT
ncbi:carboxymuconolactone decarboxylase family protein [Paraflavitalea speifideaquila]|uniref:carboxymuconolactone decarboxylase family protein n=1 Tax=Paraflavitalea speifideaquila TaxID=3076558 RepID=UPI0028E51470|nr:carboxymuconolactone decarboxylase family protein [Paraflavitalea speifideiaquila]